MQYQLHEHSCFTTRVVVFPDGPDLELTESRQHGGFSLVVDTFLSAIAVAAGDGVSAFFARRWKYAAPGPANETDASAMNSAAAMTRWEVFITLFFLLVDGPHRRDPRKHYTRQFKFPRRFCSALLDAARLRI